jgi:excisionase family DNA binding protein
LNQDNRVSRLNENEGPQNLADATALPTALSALEIDPVLTPCEAAASLRISVATLLRLSRHGEIPGVRIGKLWRYRKSALDEWLRSKVIFFRHPCRK